MCERSLSLVANAEVQACGVVRGREEGRDQNAEEEEEEEQSTGMQRADCKLTVT